MATLRYEQRIDAPAEVVWSVVGDPTSIPQWFPGIVSCEVEGSRRTIHTATGLEMPEEILAHDSLEHHFAYRITAPIYRYHLGTIDVAALDESSSTCVYETTAVPDVLALIIGGGTIGALREIGRLAEARFAES
ncbi:MAG TPA: SRPBCC family protein [Acidimicrobiales bacterium]|nr:SRPBCC family protein [Acidimicrobiales bacterium]